MPLYGDMVVGPFKYIERTPNYEPEKWEKCASASVSSQAELLKNMSEIRQQHTHLVCELALQGANKDALRAALKVVSGCSVRRIQLC